MSFLSNFTLYKWYVTKVVHCINLVVELLVPMDSFSLVYNQVNYHSTRQELVTTFFFEKKRLTSIVVYKSKYRPIFILRFCDYFLCSTWAQKVSSGRERVGMKAGSERSVDIDLLVFYRGDRRSIPICLQTYIQ